MSDFNWNTFDSQTALDENPPLDYEVAPAGWYPTMVIEGEWKDTNGKSGPGRMLVLVAEIIDGPYKGKRCWNNFNLINSNPKAVAIAKGGIGSLGVACGVLRPRGFEEFFRKPVMAKWTVTPATDAYPAKNEVKEWKPMFAAPAQVAAPADPNRKPWEK